ncbi:choline transporter-like protein 1 [Haliotis rufescens]|uniref:choline transporter-like protein 1 n=1 Tax=Haliotis rufescens TaxID=6454 RepID=UPI001EB014DA|nr:choline transporter-like protein 1 [Haliotis rufescens]
MMGCCASGNEVTDLRQSPTISQMAAEDYAVGVAGGRSCTDIPFLLLFLAFIGGMGYVSYIGIQEGDPYRLINGYDSWGNVCGRPNKKIANVVYSGLDMTTRPNTFFQDEAYFFKKFLPSFPADTFRINLPPSLANWKLGDPLTSTNPIVCVVECPTTELVTSSSIEYLCTYDNGTCPSLPVLPHKTLLNRCVPSSFSVMIEAVTSSIKTAISGEVPQRVFTDIQNTWREQLYLAGISFGIALIIVVLLRFLAAIVVWTVIILMLLVFFAAAGYCWYLFYNLHTDLQEKVVKTTAMQAKVDTWMVYASVASVIAIIVFLLVIFLWKRIKLVVQLFKEAGSVFESIPLLLIQPVSTLIILLSVVGALVFIGLYIETAGEPVIDAQTTFVKYELNDMMQYLRWYHFFGVLWMSAFVVACQDLIIAGAVSVWYFSSDKSQLGCPICRSIYNLIRYHLGTVAFGSLILAIIRIVRFILSRIQKRLHKKSGKLVDFFLKMLQCCLYCFENFIKYLNRNAYIMTASHGYNFFTGAKKAFMILLANILRVAAINSIGNFVLFLAKIGCVAVTVLVGNEFFKMRDDINYVWAPLTAAGAVAFAIAHCFMLVYEITMDTIFLCFCEDCEENDGVTKPYFMSKNLMLFVNNVNKDAENREAKKNKTKRDTD